MQLNLICVLPIVLNLISIVISIILQKYTSLDTFTSFMISILSIELITVIFLFKRTTCIKDKKGIHIFEVIAGFIGINVIAGIIFPAAEGIGLDSTSKYVYVLFLGPLFEELIFRGICIDVVDDTLSKNSKCILSAILFAIFHSNFEQGLVALFSGYLLAKLKLERGLIYSIIAHISCNMIVHFAGRYIDLLSQLLFLSVAIFQMLGISLHICRKDFKDITSVGLVFSIVVFIIMGTLSLLGLR